jgi:hypothetical protein
MSRNEVIRHEVLNRDGHRCQICGAEDNLEVDHVRPLGIGGSDERDIAENMITLCTVCHRKKHEGGLTIARWIPGAELEVMDVEGRRIDHSRLWFYRRQLVEKLEPVEARIQWLYQIDGKAAADLYELWRDDNYLALDPEAKSFREYSESRGWDTNRAMSLISTYRKAQDAGIEWDQGQTVTDVRRALKDIGIDQPRKWKWLYFGKDGNRLVLRATDDEIADLTKTGGTAIRIGKQMGESLVWLDDVKELTDAGCL